MFGGMFTHRLIFLFYYLMVFWLCCNPFLLRPASIAAALAILYSYVQLSFLRHEILFRLSSEARSVVSSGVYIRSKSLVYSYNYSGLWTHFHFSNYAGVNKEVIMSDNYEALLQWFPLKLKLEKYEELKSLADYVLIYGEPEKINMAENLEVRNFIRDRTFPCYFSKDGFCRLYKVLKEPLPQN
jgi:hypothetical protein